MTRRHFPPRLAARRLSLRWTATALAALAPAAPLAAAEEWRPPRGHEPTLGELVTALISGGASGLAAPLMLAALLLALLVGMQVLGSRS